MREICVPIPFTDDEQVAEVEVKFANRKISVQYRLESFLWQSYRAASADPVNAIKYE